jgi:hypothetical protein
LSVKIRKSGVYGARKDLTEGREGRNERGKGDKRNIKEAKGRALEKGAKARQLLSRHVGSHD